MEDKKYFCYEIYKNLAVWTNNGRLGYNPYCFFKGYIKESTSLDINAIWISPERQELKRCVENDTPILGCSTCYQAESNGLISRRLHSAKLYEEYHCDTNIDLDSPQSLDYSVGNLCNLKCVICGPHNSTQWIPDYQKINPDKNIDHLKYQKLNQLEITDSESLKNIVNVHFHGGGEPLLSKHHVNLLKKIEQVKGLGDVRVYYNTNGTVRVSDSVLALWEKCKLIELYFSIDDVGSRFNYQRTGANWNEVLHNLQWYTDYMPHNHMFNVNCVWSYLNLYYLDELVDWHASSFNANRYGDPVNLIFQKAEGNFTIDHLSTEAKQLLLKKFKGYPELRNLVNSLSENSDHSKFWATVDKIDQVRLTKFAKLCPEWSELIK